MTNRTELPYGITVFASEDVAPDAPVQQSWADGKEAMLQDIERGIAQGYDPAKDQIVGYVQDREDAADIQKAIRLRHDVHIRMFQLNEDNVNRLVRHNIT